MHKHLRAIAAIHKTGEFGRETSEQLELCCWLLIEDLAKHAKLTDTQRVIIGAILSGGTYLHRNSTPAT